MAKGSDAFSVRGGQQNDLSYKLDSLHPSMNKHSEKCYKKQRERSQRNWKVYCNSQSCLQKAKHSIKKEEYCCKDCDLITIFLYGSA